MTSKKENRFVLVIAAKAPVSGQVKTRLCTHLAPETATDLYRCFLQDTVEQMAGLKGIDLAISYAPEDAAAYFTGFAGQGFALFPQNGKDLGLREPHPELFCNIPWSTAAVLDKTLAIAQRSALSTRLLAPWNDLDSFEDLLAYYRRHRRRMATGPG